MHSLKVSIVPQEWISARSRDANLWRLVSSYHEYGHRAAATNPLQLSNAHVYVNIYAAKPYFVVLMLQHAETSHYISTLACIEPVVIMNNY